MSIQDKISALEAEIAAANARITKAKPKQLLPSGERPSIVPVPPKMRMKC